MSHTSHKHSPHTTHAHIHIQRAYLLEGTEQLQKSSDRLEEGIRIAKETEEIGMDVMDTLQRDRETIQRMRGRVSGGGGGESVLDTSILLWLLQYGHCF